MKIIKFLLIGICSVFCSVCSCATGMTETASHILGNVSESPMFISCKAVSETELNFHFTLPVNVTSVHFRPPVQVDSVEGGNIVRIHFSGGPGPGEKLTVDILAEDEKGNTINVLVPLRTRNSRVPKLIITELRTEYSKPRCEYIELKILEAGNLGAVRLFAAGNTASPMIYEFPSIETAAGEYVIIHLRTLDEAVSRDELGSDLELSGGTDSWPTARDLWIPGAIKLLRKTDAVYLLDQDDNVLDAVMISEKTDPWWNSERLAEVAAFLYEAGAWKNAAGNICGPAEAVRSTGTTATRTICRDETVKDTNTAADWYITATSSATPGRENNPKRYEP